MQFVNETGLPKPVADAIIAVADGYELKGDISVTGLAQPVRAYQLTKRHDDEIVVDVTDLTAILLGLAWHKIMEQGDTPGAIKEKTFTYNSNGWVVSGTTDLYYKGFIHDHKVTSAMALIFGVKPEWVAQLNCYAEMWRLNGFPVKGFGIMYVSKDHNENTKKRIGSDYPEKDILNIPISMWSSSKTQEYISTRVLAHQEAEKLSDADLPMCTPAERWHKQDTFAVKIKSQKKAKRVLNSEKEAIDWMKNHPIDRKYEIEFREGNDARCCKKYCHAKPFCNKGE